MKLFDDLIHVLDKTDCEKCEFEEFCDQGVNGTYYQYEDKDDYSLCEVLKMCKNMERGK